MPGAPPYKWLCRDEEAVGGVLTTWRVRPRLSAAGYWNALPLSEYLSYAVVRECNAARLRARGVVLPGFGECVEMGAGA